MADHDLPERATVMVLLEVEAMAVLSPEDEAELVDRVAAAERGEIIEYTDLDQMIRDLCR